MSDQTDELFSDASYRLRYPTAVPPRPAPRWGAGLGAGAALAGLAILLAAILPASPTTPKAPNAGNAQRTDDAEVLMVDAPALMQAFTSAPNAAAEKYSDYGRKRVDVFGVVTRVDASSDYAAVELRTDSKSRRLHCGFSRQHAAEAKGLRVGQLVRLRGKCLGFVDGPLTLKVVDCRVIE